MSWHFSRALVEASSAASCSGGGASAPSSSSPTHGTCWSPGRTTEASSPSRSGMTFAPSTGTRGEALLGWCLEASRARTSPVPERAPDWRALVQDSGGRWHESLARYNPATSTWRTRQCSLLGGSESFSGTWPRWGLMLGGEFWELTMPALPTSGIGSGLRLATPTATTNQLCPSMQKHPGCRAMWGTPTAHPRTHTPRDVDHGAQLANQVGGSLNPTWVEWLMGWPLGWTDCEPSGTARQKHPGCRAMWATPRAGIRDARLTYDRGRSNLEEQIGASVEGGGSLNPTWVEWLMGWPLGWTDCEPSGTAKSPNAPRWPGRP